MVPAWAARGRSGALMTASSYDVDDARKRVAQWEAVRAGRLPTTRDLLNGSPFFKGGWQADAQTFFADCLLVEGIDDAQRSALEHARDTLSDVALTAVVGACKSSLRLGAAGRMLSLRVLLYRAADGDADARREFVNTLLDFSQSEFQRHRTLPMIAIALGILDERGGFSDTACALDTGMRVLSDHGQAAARWLDADKKFDGTTTSISVLKELADLTTVDDDEPDQNPTPTAGLIVVPELVVDVGSRERQATRKSFKAIAGIPLPFVNRGDVGAHNLALLRRFPHAGSVISTILGDLASREAVRFRPTILVGPPGYAKTSLARAICSQLGVPAVVYTAGGVADSTLSGTSAQWSTAGASVPLQLVLQHRVANPAVIIDEIDKASHDRRNGSVFDGLLAFLERSTSAAIRDPALEEVVDLSWVSWLLTANEVADVPAPLRDRCRVVEMPRPEWRHVGDLVRGILDDIASERDLDRRWIDELAGDELELVRKTWSSGSIRKLRRIVETIVDGRENFVGRA